MKIEIELEDFDNDDIVEYAKENLGLVKIDDVISNAETEELIEELSYRSVSVYDFEFPHNILSKDLIDTLYENIDKVNLEELEQFLNKRGLW